MFIRPFLASNSLFSSIYSGCLHVHTAIPHLQFPLFHLTFYHDHSSPPNFALLCDLHTAIYSSFSTTELTLRNVLKDFQQAAPSGLQTFERSVFISFGPSASYFRIRDIVVIICHRRHHPLIRLLSFFRIIIIIVDHHHHLRRLRRLSLPLFSTIILSPPYILLIEGAFPDLVAILHLLKTSLFASDIWVFLQSPPQSVCCRLTDRAVIYSILTSLLRDRRIDR